jgi:L-2-hydroxyglutarate oxidase LhgO
VVIGGGVVGLAVARALALAGRAPLLLEKNAHLGEETSARNSEVIHAGLYYAEGSLKGRLCVEGKRSALSVLRRARRAPSQHRQADRRRRPRELAALERIDAAARANGVDDLVFLDRRDAAARARARRRRRALVAEHGRSSTATPTCWRCRARRRPMAPRSCARDRARRRDRCRRRRDAAGARGDGAEIGLRARAVVNAAGLWAQRVAASARRDRPGDDPAAASREGVLFRAAGRAPFSTLVYPAPGGGGLGVHLTLDMAGRARFGPDTEWLDGATPETLDYAVDPARGDVFYAAIRRYWPGLPDGALAADYAGVRPKIAADRGLAADFRIDGPEACGAAGCVMLYGVESPGLTASLAIAREVVARLDAT